MGLIQQQTIKGTVYSFFGVLIGFVSLVIISTKFFTSDQIGLTQVMTATATILAQLGSLGFNNITNRLFPYFRSSENGHNGYLSLAFLVTVTGFILCLIAFSFYIPGFIERNSEKSGLLSDYAWYIPVLLALIMLFSLLDNYCKVLFNAVIGTFLKDFVLRLITLGLVILFSCRLISFDTYILLFVISQAVPVLVIIGYLILQNEFKFVSFKGFLTRDLAKQMLSLAVFGIIAGLSGIAITSIDKYMLNSFNGLGDVGVYSIAVYFATLILIPARSLGKIAVPVISEAWKSNDLKLINNIYYKSSINQMLIGLLIFIGILANMDNIFRVLPPEYAQGKMVIIYFGIANLISASAGACKIILSTSKHYRYLTYLMLALIVIVIVSNIILIPLIGITGAAVASLISMFIYTGLTIMVLKVFFGLWPFTVKHIIVLILTIAIYLLVSLIPELSLVFDIAIRSILICVLFATGVLIFNLSEDGKLLFKRARNQFIKRS